MPVLSDPRHEAFARLVAGGKKKRDAAIEAGFEGKYASATGSKLAKSDKIRQRIDELSGKIEQQVVETAVKAETLAITDRSNRVALLQDIANRLLMVATERGADPKMQGIPGGKSGLLVAQIKVVRTEKGLQAGYEYSVDTAFVRELRAVAQQCAEETGQWRKNEEERPPVDVIAYKWVDETGDCSAEDTPLIQADMSDAARVQ